MELQFGVSTVRRLGFFDYQPVTPHFLLVISEVGKENCPLLIRYFKASSHHIPSQIIITFLPLFYPNYVTLASSFFE